MQTRRSDDLPGRRAWPPREGRQSRGGRLRRMRRPELPPPSLRRLRGRTNPAWPEQGGCPRSRAPPRALGAQPTKVTPSMRSDFTHCFESGPLGTVADDAHRPALVSESRGLPGAESPSSCPSPLQPLKHEHGAVLERRQRHGESWHAARDHASGRRSIVRGDELAHRDLARDPSTDPGREEAPDAAGASRSGEVARRDDRGMVQRSRG